MPAAVVVDWSGPYTGLEALCDVVQAEWQGVPRVLYMALARRNKYQYVDLTTNPVDASRRNTGGLRDRRRVA